MAAPALLDDESEGVLSVAGVPLITAHDFGPALGARVLTAAGPFRLEMSTDQARRYAHQILAACDAAEAAQRQSKTMRLIP